MTGGALVFGSLRTILSRPKLAESLALAAGLRILANALVLEKAGCTYETRNSLRARQACCHWLQSLSIVASLLFRSRDKESRHVGGGSLSFAGKSATNT